MGSHGRSDGQSRRGGFAGGGEGHRRLSRQEFRRAGSGRATRAKRGPAFLMPLYEIDGLQPTVPATSWVAPSADLIGDVRLGAGVGIWFGAVIRADNTPIMLGDRTNI